ncbi:MAG: Ig-like domain-containing protein [Bryobacterales bacterium]|nr:Ig-like domain-containing protein [Bryobacterales bacterium]
MHLIKKAIAIVAITAGLAEAQITALVDTGAGGTSSIGAPSLFGAGSTGCSPQPRCATDFNFLGARFTLTQSTQLDHVDLWLTGGSGGQVSVVIRSVDPARNGLPGMAASSSLGASAIYQQTYTVDGAGAAQWVTFSSFTPVLAAGTYWVTFEPVVGTGFNRSAATGVASPLERYAYFGNENIGYFDLTSNDAFGVRVWGAPFAGLTFGTATRSMMTGNPSGPFDTISGGEGKALDYHWIIDLAGYGGTFAVGRLTAGLEDSSIENLNGLSAGANASTCWSLYWGPCASAGARGVAYRTFKNTSSTAKTIRIKTVLHGAYYTGGKTAAFVYVLKQDGFTSTIGTTPPEQYLLQRDGLGALRNGDGTLSLANLFPNSVLAMSSAFPGFQDGVLQSIPMQTGQFTVAPGGYFVLLFDVSAFSQNGGSANFGETMTPAADFIIDESGNPVPEIVALGPPAPVSKPAASITLTPASASVAIGQAQTIVATVRDANGAPLKDKTVTFHMLSGPNKAEPGALVTDANGQATFSYSSPTAGTDQITATVKSVTSNQVSVGWTSPGLLDHIALSPASGSIVAGGNQSYTATAFDKFNNTIGNVTSTTTFSISPNGSCTGAVCTAAVAGPHTVTGANGGKTAQASLNVTGGASDAAGPVTSNVTLGQNAVAIRVATTVRASVSDATTGGSNIASASFSVNGGAWQSMLLAPAAATTTQASATLPAFNEPGVYEICVRGTDVPGNTGAAVCASLAVYDPSGGFITGAVQFASPAGADRANPTASGLGLLAFIATYLPRQTTPTGALEFQFKPGNIGFKSTSMAWMVLTNQRQGTLRGAGLLNGNNACQYELKAWDGSFNGTDAVSLRIFGCASGGDRFYLLPTATPNHSLLMLRW